MNKSQLEVDAGLVIDNLIAEIGLLTKDKAILLAQVQQLTQLVRELKEQDSSMVLE